MATQAERLTALEAKVDRILVAVEQLTAAATTTQTDVLALIEGVLDTRAETLVRLDGTHDELREDNTTLHGGIGVILRELSVLKTYSDDTREAIKRYFVTAATDIAKKNLATAKEDAGDGAAADKTSDNILDELMR